VRVGHPSLRRLQRWLEGAEESLSRHLETCEHCVSRIEDLDEQAAPIRQPLLDLLAPPEELTSRLRGGIDERLRSREDLALLSELFGLPIRAARVMSSSSQKDV